MAEPLEYRNPKHRAGEIARAPNAEVPLAIPVEFDRCIVKTDDHAAARAIGAALLQAKIEFFRSDGVEHVGRAVRLHVRSADADRAMDVAGVIFARRAKFRSHPHTRPVQLPEVGQRGPDFW